jgi:hypothetical protein
MHIQYKVNVNRTGKVRIYVTLRHIRVTIAAVEKLEVLHILSVCAHILALVIRHAKSMCRIILTSVACQTLPYFSKVSHERHDFQKNVIATRVFLYNL